MGSSKVVPEAAVAPRTAIARVGTGDRFVDATGGGGWGPVTTPTLLTVTKTEPRMVIGTVNAAEFIVASAATITFLATASMEGMVWQPVIGLIGGAISAWAVTRKYRMGYDDSLDVVGVHGVGGFVGMIGIGLFSAKLVNASGADGLFISGSFSQLNKQLIASVLTAAFSFIATWLMATAISKTIGFRVDRNTELEGLDTTIHAESAYEFNR